MSDLDQSLVPGETVTYRTGLHWFVLLAPVVLGSILVLGAVAAWIASFRLASDGWGPGALRIAGLALGVCGALLIGAGVLRRSSVVMAVTNRRVLIQQGIVSRRTTELLLSKVESIGVEQGITARFADYGRVVVRGTGGTHEVFERIARPLEFRRQVQMQIQRDPAPPTGATQMGSA